jgi:predicted anti-sigma-YlaC factor YlaD
MDCADARQAVSAALDDELNDIESQALAAHLARCAECRRHRARLSELQRATRVRSADDVPDLVAPIMAAVTLPSPQRGRDLEWVRYVLLAIGLTQLVLALPAFLLGEESGASVHAARELGSFDLALAVGLVVAAWQPRRAAGLLPFVAVLAVATTISATTDLVGGRASIADEAHHVLDLVGLALLWLATRIGETPRRRAVRLA